MRGSGGGRPGTPEPAQRRLAPPQSRHRPLHVTRRGHVSSALGAMAPSPGGSRQLVLPEVTSPPPGAASDPTGSGGRKPEGPVVWRRGIMISRSVCMQLMVLGLLFSLHLYHLSYFQVLRIFVYCMLIWRVREIHNWN